MGNNLTSEDCLDRLGIQAQSHSAFKTSVLKYLELNATKGPEYLHAIEESELTNLTKNYLRDEFATKFQRQPLVGRHPQPTNTELHGWLEQLVREWIADKDRQDSQDDPEWSEVPGPPSTKFKERKRKRLTEPTSSTKAQNEKPTKKSLAGQNIKTMLATPTHQRTRDVYSISPRSPTIDRGPGLPRNADARMLNNDEVEHINIESEDELPSHSQIIADRSRPRSESHTDGNARLDTTGVAASAAEARTLSKGKAPVREPPGASLPVSPRGVQFGQSRQPHYSSHNSSESDQDAEPSRRSPLAARHERTQSRRTLMELEGSESVVNHSPTTVTGFANLNAPTHIHNHSSSTVKPITPPPTLRPVKTVPWTATGPVAFGQAANPPTPVSAFPRAAPDIDTELSDGNANINQVPQLREERLVGFIYSLLEYVNICESHSLAIIHNPHSSPRERETHQIRAQTFSNLRADMGSRVTAFMTEENNAVSTPNGSNGPNGASGGTGAGVARSQVTSYCLWR